jgi:hypothetical protein
MRRMTPGPATVFVLRRLGLGFLTPFLISRIISFATEVLPGDAAHSRRVAANYGPPWRERSRAILFVTHNLAVVRILAQ